jgi:hypothetical protein
MARDLIPPPSPAGQPVPDGTPNLIELPPETPEKATMAPPPRGPSDFRNRFGFIIGGLGGVILAAAAIAAIALTSSGTKEEGLFKNWSKWQPEETSMTAGPAEIATHVAPQYKMDDGTQLVNVTAGPLAVQSVPIDDVLVQAQDSIHQLSGHAIMYTLSGLGPRGSIVGGKPSKERHRLVRREALELALYTFRYVKDVTSVVTFFPPKKGDDMSFAVYFDKSSFAKQLDNPLHQTLRSRPVAVNLTPSERKTVDQLTQRRVLHFAYERDTSGQRVLVLAPELG